jgi:hypothetical protein
MVFCFFYRQNNTSENYGIEPLREDGNESVQLSQYTLARRPNREKRVSSSSCSSSNSSRFNSSSSSVNSSSSCQPRLPANWVQEGAEKI